MRQPGFRLGYEEARRAHVVAREVRVARLAKGLSQAALARRAGTTQSAISRLELGDTPPSLRTLARLGEALGLEVVVELRRPRTRRRPTRVASRAARSREV